MAKRLDLYYISARYPDAFPSLDILVYTPDEFRALTSDPSPGFWSSAVSNMKRIV